VAEADAAVTDTHALLMHIGGSRSLGLKAAAHFRAAHDGRAIVYVPMAVLMEVTFLARVDRIDLRRTPEAFFSELFLNPAYQAFNLAPEQVSAADQWRFNRDPWDALIVAAAQVLGLPLITRDTAIVSSKSVKVLW
jgi:PIN domain nuclease of toxin-antitoxin system